MNFIQRKLKRKRPELEEGEIVDDEKENPKKVNKIVSWVKDAFTALKSFGKNDTTGPDITRSGITLFTTPEPLKSSRYSMTPHPVISPGSGAAEPSYYEKGSILQLTEDRLTEFKAGGGRYVIDILPEHIRKYGSGFLNSNGGTLLIGVCDDGFVQGISCNGSRCKSAIENRIKQEFSRFIPKVTSSMYSVTFVPVSQTQTDWEGNRGYRRFWEDVYILKIRIKMGEAGELYEDGLHKVFIRREGSVEGPLNPLQIKDLVLTKYREKIKEREKKRKREEEETETRRPAKQSKLAAVKIDLTQLSDD